MNPDALATLLFNLPDQPTFSIDSRRLKSGDIYVALKGEKFDGHDFIPEAIAKNAAGIIGAKAQTNLAVPYYQVASPLDTLTSLASYHRSRCQAKIIALTGSNGKTSVKEMIAAILPLPSYATEGNLNNHIGVPLSLLKMKTTDRYAVFELGASHPGEIAHTAALVKPDVALVNNIAPAHIEGFGSLDKVASAKGEIYQALGQHGIAIINDEDAYSHFWDEILAGKVQKRFSAAKKRDCYPHDLEWSANHCARFSLAGGGAVVELQVPGRHSLLNALAAASATLALGLELETVIAGLNRFQGVKGRLTRLAGKNDAIVIDDTYNANLRSVLTAIDVLSDQKGLRILVLGDMGELGSYAENHHEEVGKKAHALGIDKLMTVGKHSRFATEAFGSGASHYETQAALAEDLIPILDKETTVLVKGSRSAAMENIVHKLVKE